jgi:protein phosphatase
MASLLIAFGSATDMGRVRTSNEDSLCVQLLSSGGLRLLAAVADGMGGAAAGEVASRLALETVQSVVERYAAQVSSDEDIAELLTYAVQQANSAVRQMAREQAKRNGMGTTLTVALLHDDCLHLAHVGDSRAYLLRGAETRQLTTDHIAGGGFKHVLTNAIGLQERVDVDTAAVTVQEGDVMLLCTDGLHNLVNPASVRRLLQRLSPQDICERLVAMANARGGRDNVSVVCLRFGSGAWATSDRAGRRSSRRFRLAVALIIGLTIVALMAQTLWRKRRSAPEPSPPTSLSKSTKKHPPKRQGVSKPNANKPQPVHQLPRKKNEEKTTQ